MLKNSFIFALIVLACNIASAQNISKITLTNTPNQAAVAFDIDVDNGNAIIKISETGAILKWGVDLYKNVIENYAEKLEAYAGRTGYYTDNDNEAFRGKIKYIGSTLITYYASYDGAEFQGKIKSIGSLNLEYYAAYADEVTRGKIKSIGSSAIAYYPAYENEAVKGKLKTIANTAISYYSSFDDKAIKGKVKSIGSASYTYYTSFDMPEYRGSMKTGVQMQLINNIKYYVRN